MAEIAPAKVVLEKGCRWWRCPNCGQKMAELVGERVVIKAAGVLISLRARPVEQGCPRCGMVSELSEAA